MKFDLHCHSNASDGKLEPLEVIRRVEAENVTLFALTDHDTIAGYEVIAEKESSCLIVSGIELSTVWSGVGIHIIGLDFDPESDAIRDAIKHQRDVRYQRAQEIDRKLAKKGMPDTFAGALQFCSDPYQVGRPHFAEFMMEKGYVSSMNEAFDKWLGNGKIGDVKSGWPQMSEAVEWIRNAGGVSVLAHPLKYKMTFSKIRRLLDSFAEAGGDGVEVVGQQAQPDQLKQLRKVVTEKSLAGSGGSDFHDPSWAWAQIGRVDDIPENITPIWKTFERTKI